ncbi:putative hydroxymethylpyrimidine transporter CytX [Sporomusa malonica]|uniref:Putative hydroxymethylpyrimidine transporter CytX n=1 Tax=Sporomusa malonica TaxID=112901 RepID=A0A1W2DEK6_9FIRM|nr:putative hydroxymethylpyrimidine transporter CytX [Sporomusa malonica]SMC95905.1 putative hydroxymethylpyrimidine transporter CytX [Sporomusa malonica]
MTSINYMLLWFGAAVSIAEIITGGLLAPLGFAKGATAIVLGHLVGTTILVLGGIIGSQTKLPAIMTTRISFGIYGSYLFAALNIMQLIGWTAVMIVAGGRSVNQITKMVWSFDNMTLWSLVIGALIFLWIAAGNDGLKKINSAAVALLFVLTVVLSGVVFTDSSLFTKQPAGDMSFGGALELSVIMPLSWLPLIADYTRFARKTSEGAWGSWIGYFAGSCWMYLIGLGAAIVTGDSDPAAMMLAANLGLAALGIVVLSTVTTTFLDAYSAGVSCTNLLPDVSERKLALAMAVVGTALAIVINIEQYESFLYAIGSVFAPLFAVLLTDYFFLGRQQADARLLVNWGAVIVWAVGVVMYYQFVKLDLVVGATVPVMVVTGVIYAVSARFMVGWKSVKAAKVVS